MHLNFALHLVMHWFIEALYPHRAYNHVVLCILIILPFYVDLNQQEHTSIYIDSRFCECPGPLCPYLVSRHYLSGYAVITLINNLV